MTRTITADPYRVTANHRPAGSCATLADAITRTGVTDLTRWRLEPGNPDEILTSLGAGPPGSIEAPGVAYELISALTTAQLGDRDWSGADDAVRAAVHAVLPGHQAAEDVACRVAACYAAANALGWPQITEALTDICGVYDLGAEDNAAAEDRAGLIAMAMVRAGLAITAPRVPAAPYRLLDRHGDPDRASQAQASATLPDAMRAAGFPDPAAWEFSDAGPDRIATGFAAELAAPHQPGAPHSLGEWVIEAPGAARHLISMLASDTLAERCWRLGAVHDSWIYPLARMSAPGAADELAARQLTALAFVDGHLTMDRIRQVIAAAYRRGRLEKLPGHIRDHAAAFADGFRDAGIEVIDPDQDRPQVGDGSRAR